MNLETAAETVVLLKSLPEGPWHYWDACETGFLPDNENFDWVEVGKSSYGPVLRPRLGGHTLDGSDSAACERHLNAMTTLSGGVRLEGKAEDDELERYYAGDMSEYELVLQEQELRLLEDVTRTLEAAGFRTRLDDKESCLTVLGMVGYTGKPHASKGSGR